MTGYSGVINFNCLTHETENFGYPFDFHITKQYQTNGTSCSILVISTSTSDAKFFVTTGVLTMLFTLLVMVVYMKLNEKYKSDSRFPQCVSKHIFMSI